jgi:hypothetical protein
MRDEGVVTEAMYSEFGFSKNLYLFRSGFKLSNFDIDNLSRLVRLASAIASARAGGRQIVEYSDAEPLRVYYPKLPQMDDVLANVRELSLVGRRHREPREQVLASVGNGNGSTRPDPLAGRPPRHFVPAHHGHPATRRNS